MNEYTPTIALESIESGYNGYHKNENHNEMAMAQNANRYNYFMWLNQINAERQNWNEQFEKTNAYNDPSAQRQRLEAAGINPAFALNNTPATMPTSGLSSPSPAQKANTFPNTPNILHALDSLNTSIGNYFTVRNQEATTANIDAQTDYLRGSTQFRIAQERQQYVNMLKTADGMDQDSRYKDVLIDEATEGLRRLRRLSSSYDDIVRGSAQRFEQDRKESEERILASQVNREISLAVARSNIRVNDAQINVFSQQVSNIIQQTENLKKAGDLTDAQIEKLSVETAKACSEFLSLENNRQLFEDSKDLIREISKNQYLYKSDSYSIDNKPVAGFVGQIFDYIMRHSIDHIKLK